MLLIITRQRQNTTSVLFHNFGCLDREERALNLQAQVSKIIKQLWIGLKYLQSNRLCLLMTVNNLKHKHHEILYRLYILEIKQIKNIIVHMNQL